MRRSWDVHFIFDSERISKEEILGLMHDIGQFGFGRDATTGMGRFQVNFEASSTHFPKEQKNSNSWLTLAPTAPQQIGIDPQRSWYQPFVRFGRHGNIGATGRFLKKPLLFADTGAVTYTCGRLSVQAIYWPGYWRQKLADFGFHGRNGTSRICAGFGHQSFGKGF